jgi:uncharacterized protein
MKSIIERITAIDRNKLNEELNTKGHTILQHLLTADECAQLITAYDQPALYRKTITMERYRFGRGEYKYFTYPLPNLIQEIREHIYPVLSPVANSWMKALNIPVMYPDTLNELQTRCHAADQTKPTVLILKYGAGGFNTLHQDLYGDVFFPMQLVLFLNEPDVDYTGGEFVLTQQIPRAQSKAIVLKPQKGDALIFTTNFRPEKGSKGYYRVNMKHGVSEVHNGNRHTLGIIFHDALT